MCSITKIDSVHKKDFAAGDTLSCYAWSYFWHDSICVNWKDSLNSSNRHHIKMDALTDSTYRTTQWKYDTSKINIGDTLYYTVVAYMRTQKDSLSYKSIVKPPIYQFEPESIALFNRYTQQPTDSLKLNIDSLIKRLKSNNVQCERSGPPCRVSG